MKTYWRFIALLATILVLSPATGSGSADNPDKLLPSARTGKTKVGPSIPLPANNNENREFFEAASQDNNRKSFIADLPATTKFGKKWEKGRFYQHQLSDGTVARRMEFTAPGQTTPELTIWRNRDGEFAAYKGKVVKLETLLELDYYDEFLLILPTPHRYFYTYALSEESQAGTPVLELKMEFAYDDPISKKIAMGSETAPKIFPWHILYRIDKATSVILSKKMFNRGHDLLYSEEFTKLIIPDSWDETLFATPTKVDEILPPSQSLAVYMLGKPIPPETPPEREKALSSRILRQLMKTESAVFLFAFAVAAFGTAFVLRRRRR